MPTRQCPHCGKVVFDQSTQCPYCREALSAVPDVRLTNPDHAVGRGRMRQGLLCMLLGALVYYFAGGYSGFQLPFPFAPPVTTYVALLMLLTGVVLGLFGLVSQRKS